VPAVRWRPWKVPHVVLGDQDTDCAGCRARRCPFGPAQPCLADVTSETVLAAVEGLRARSGPADRRAMAIPVEVSR
jgi:hypothetical protein